MRLWPDLDSSKDLRINLSLRPMEISRKLVNRMGDGEGSGSGPNWKNVNNWHWIEKDCTGWAHDRLKELLPSVKTIVDGKVLKVVKVDSIEGDVSVNVRKGRIRQIFDLTMQFGCEYDGDDVDARINDYMSDTDFDGFEFYLSGVPSNVKNTLRRHLWDKLEEFKAEVERVHGKSLLINASQTEGGEKVRFSKVVDQQENKAKVPEMTGTIEQKITINAPLEQVWSCLTDPDRIQAWTRGTAKLNTFEPGATFTLLNGNIIGMVTSLGSTQLKMDWRLKHWRSDCVSQVEIMASNDGQGSTKLKVKQVGVPTTEVDSVKENWHRYYWEPIRTILGCSSVIF